MKNYFTKILLVSFICIFASVACKAQYATGIGIRAGKVASGIDVKHFFNTEHQLAIEVNAGYTLEAHGGYFAKLFLIKQASIKKSNIPFPLKLIFRQSRLQIPLKFIYGAGIHAGYFA